ncbi:hypothetical protein RND71_001183 [Anisodus tanguticus]|uniref:microtubule-severing ATPase n=1 Tax=Anisodus tanguticus TaxID=243964 RepID=A0AAE1T0R0_9SOLA|nr:hypothetical protein RND71_001183 [Anisodus tanguticus]
MSFLKDLAETLRSIFSDNTPSSPSSSPNDPQHNSGDRTMDGVATGNERTAYKLKGYFELAKEEIAKAVRAEEWGLADDAISHYHNAQKILAEGISTPAPSYITSRSSFDFLDFWSSMSAAVGGTSSVKNSAPQTQRVAVPQSSSSARKGVSRSAPGSGKDSSVMRVPSNSISSRKPSQESATASGYDPKLVDMINSVIVDRSPSVKWEDIAGLEKAKQALLEMVILPTKRKDLFTGLRRPARGLLLFGPPGTGKTMLAKAVASESQATFFNVSASSLTSKWVGEGEKLVKTLFMVAISRQPSVIFIDEIKVKPGPSPTPFHKQKRAAWHTKLLLCMESEEGSTTLGESEAFLVKSWIDLCRNCNTCDAILENTLIDSIMSTRTTNENEASRRLKSEFLVQFDGVTSNSDGLVIVIAVKRSFPSALTIVSEVSVYANAGATNKPQELDDAVLRRLGLISKVDNTDKRDGHEYKGYTTLPLYVKRIYIPLPDDSVRRELLKHRLKGKAFSLPDGDLERLVRDTEGYSGSDLQALCEEAAMMPIRELGANILSVKANQVVRGLRYGDFQKAMTVIRPSLQKSKWEELERWNQEFGAN